MTRRVMRLLLVVALLGMSFGAAPQQAVAHWHTGCAHGDYFNEEGPYYWWKKYIQQGTSGGTHVHEYDHFKAAYGMPWVYDHSERRQCPNH